MLRSSRELWWAFAAIVAVTALYALVTLTGGGLPASRELFGHGIGVVGFVLMLMTETLYSLRKRSRLARWGRMAAWLQFHIFTGLVGPYMVLLHTAFRYNGLAGVASLMTLVVVGSGILGRYIYTAIPRTADGVELQVDEVEREIGAAEAELARLLDDRPQVAAFFSRQLATAGAAAALDRPLSWAGRLRSWRMRQGLDREARRQAHRIQGMLARRRALQRQLTSLARARQAMALWHAVHLPLGLAMFSAAFVHVGAALYYATLLK